MSRDELKRPEAGVNRAAWEAAHGGRPACVGATGGKATAAAKREASRRNGAKGGRPRKRPANGTGQKGS